MIKIPAALKWLLDRRARLLGEIKKVNKRFDIRETLLIEEQATLEKRLETVRSRLARVQALRLHVPAQLQLKLNAIDQAIHQHNAMVDVDLVTPRTSQDNAWYLPHGAMSRYILRALREAQGQALTTDEIAIFVATEGGLTLIPDPSYDRRRGGHESRIGGPQKGRRGQLGSNQCHAVHVWASW